MNNKLKEIIPGTFANDEYAFFWGGFMSNWYPSYFYYTIPSTNRKHKFSNAEQAMMAVKAYVLGDEKTLEKVLKQPDPEKAKALGRQIKNYDESKWGPVRENLVTLILVAKFKQNPELAKLLLATGERHIVEASPFDNVWGIKMGLNHPDLLDESKWRGQNLLGKALMTVREALQWESTNASAD